MNWCYLDHLVLVHYVFLFSNRMANPQIEKMLNRDHVERVEIYLKESIGVDGKNFVVGCTCVFYVDIMNHLKVPCRDGDIYIYICLT